MNDKTPLQNLGKIHHQLRWTAWLMNQVQSQLGDHLANYAACSEVVKVLDAVTTEVERIITRQRDFERKPLNQRPGADLALKAQLAKARDAVASVVVAGPSWRSHK